jgi:phage shock protein PspC (stress-responsive transcriptional regulator)
MQRIATTVRLNRSVLQFDDAAYARLERYLAESAALLAGDPDPQEILADLEQAVADRCMRRMRPEQTIVTLDELAPALDEIGAVQATDAVAASSAAGTAVPPRALEQVSQGAVISGVCLGVARYFRLDVTLLRVVSALLFVLTGGAAVLVYLGAMLLLPYAPLQAGVAPVRWLPARCRAVMEYVHARIGVEGHGGVAT